MTAVVVRRLVAVLGVAAAGCIGLAVLTVLVGLGLVAATLLDAALR